MDLSKLNDLWITLETMITYLRQRIKECVKEASRQNPLIKEKLKAKIQERMATNKVNYVQVK